MEGVKKTMEKAVTEFLKVAQRDSLWVHEDDAGRSQIVSTFRSGFAEGRVTVTESSRSQEILHFEVSDVFQAVVLDWERTFEAIVRDTTVLSARESGGITRIQAQLVALTPLVPARTVSLLRVWRETEDGLLAIVDVSDSQELLCNKLPSGVLLEKVGNGTRVTWVEHFETDPSLMGIAKDDSEMKCFTSSRWLNLLKHRLSRTEFQGCISNFELDDIFTVQTMVKKMLGDMLALISPTIPDGWIQIPFEHDYFRIIHKERKCVLIHSGWVDTEAEAIFQSFQEQRNAWDPSVSDTLEVETDYGDGASLLRRRCGNTGRLQHLILQHFSPLSGMMCFSRLDRRHPFDLFTEGFAMTPCKNRSLITTVLVHMLPDGVDLELESDQKSACEHLTNKWLTLYSAV